MRLSAAVRTAPLALAAALVLIAAPRANAATRGFAALVPGTGTPVIQIGDNFEDPNWSYQYRLPKSSYNIDKEIRQPGGASNNGRWAESAKRGQPDVIRRVATPPDGLTGSQGSLLLRSRDTGRPGRPSYNGNQDDLLLRIQSRLHHYLPVTSSPSVVIRVFLPEWKYWENANGASFALRADVDGIRNGHASTEEYWPGMFIRFTPATQKTKTPTAQISVRARENGGDYIAKQITETGWWTLGMSLTPDGRIHYYASPGVDDLTPQDRIASHFPYGFRCQHLDTIVLNVANRDAGKWSTPWIIDDPTVYVLRPGTMQARQPARRINRR
jgi:hypothetical protein